MFVITPILCTFNFPEGWRVSMCQSQRGQLLRLVSLYSSRSWSGSTGDHGAWCLEEVHGPRWWQPTRMEPNTSLWSRSNATVSTVWGWMMLAMLDGKKTAGNNEIHRRFIGLASCLIILVKLLEHDKVQKWNHGHGLPLGMKRDGSSQVLRQHSNIEHICASQLIRGEWVCSPILQGIGGMAYGDRNDDIIITLLGKI